VKVSILLPSNSVILVLTEKKKELEFASLFFFIFQLGVEPLSFFFFFFFYARLR
jgi:hypothetical protein